jgi:hypothetical protein
MTDDTRCLGRFMDDTDCPRMQQCARYQLRLTLGPNTQTMWAVCLVNDGRFVKFVPVEAKA